MHRPRRVSVSMSRLEYLNNYFQYSFFIKYSTMYYYSSLEPIVATVHGVDLYMYVMEDRIKDYRQDC